MALGASTLTGETAHERMTREHLYRQRQAADDAEIKAAAERARLPIPSYAECQSQIHVNPAALAAVEHRVRTLYSDIRRLPGAPLQWLDPRFQRLRRELTNQNAAQQLRLCLEAERDFHECSASRRGWGYQNQQHAEGRRAAEQRHLTEVATRNGSAFNAAAFLSRLAGRGIFLSLNPSGKLVAPFADMLSAADRDVINANRPALLSALRLTASEI